VATYDRKSDAPGPGGLLTSVPRDSSNILNFDFGCGGLMTVVAVRP
jgi:hypothetical protein